jgi:organic hydroperoxide reductase OsmC/OhrA
MENSTFNQVKSDLRLLKKIQHSIDIQLETEERHQKRLELLLRVKQTKSVQEDIQKLQDIISNLHTEEFISRATAIESKYMDTINHLEP